jgi:hypothetical protein
MRSSSLHRSASVSSLRGPRTCCNRKNERTRDQLESLLVARVGGLRIMSASPSLPLDLLHVCSSNLSLPVPVVLSMYIASSSSKRSPAIQHRMPSGWEMDASETKGTRYSVQVSRQDFSDGSVQMVFVRRVSIIRSSLMAQQCMLGARIWRNPLSAYVFQVILA